MTLYGLTVELKMTQKFFWSQPMTKVNSFLSEMVIQKKIQKRTNENAKKDG